MDTSTERGKLKTAPNVTPLVDVVLVLLILFIILLPAVDNAVKLPLARHASMRSDDGEPVFLILSGTEAGPKALRLGIGQGEKGFLSMDGNLTSGALIAPLRAHLEGRSSPQVFLKADGRIPFRHIQKVFDLCREAGAEMVSAVTAADQSQTSDGGLS